MVWLVLRVSRQHTQKYFLCYTRYSTVQNLSNKQSAEVICKFDNLSATHAFEHIVLRINPGLTSCKDLSTVGDNNLYNNQCL